MPSALTYPGVYVEEIPSGVRTITGVATSITAFVGRALRGPTDSDPTSPVTINSYGDFERTFGGLWNEGLLSFAVRDFFLNGGQQAVIVRLFRQTSNSKKGFAKIAANGLDLIAANPGSWGNQLRARIDHDVRPPKPGEDGTKMFNLTLYDGITTKTEIHRNVSVASSHPRAIDKVLANESLLMRVDGALPGARPTKHPDLNPGDKVWENNTLSAKVATADEGDDGKELTNNEFIDAAGLAANKLGLYTLTRGKPFNLLCIPPHSEDTDIDKDLLDAANLICIEYRAFLIMDPPIDWTSKDDVVNADFS